MFNREGLCRPPLLLLPLPKWMMRAPPCPRRRFAFVVRVNPQHAGLDRRAVAVGLAHAAGYPVIMRAQLSF
jgi:hypothetical protein